ncbi:hypothetical protein [Aquimonas sp.]|jgi:hypothetical protein|uniref:hypothetical protein n=1 Tax=Aquimonas sp. TaxID=1872588 RepID=UPI0037C07BB3
MKIKDVIGEYLYRGDCVEQLKRILPDRFFRASLDMEFAGPLCHTDLNDMKREARSNGAQHFRISFWEDFPTALTRYPFSASPSALLRFRVDDLRDRGFRFTVDEYTGEGGVIASVIDNVKKSERFLKEFSCCGIPLEAIDVLCPDLKWRSLDKSGILDDRDISTSAHRFELTFGEGTARGYGWCFERSQVMYVRQHWTDGCYLTNDVSRALTAAMALSQAFNLNHPERYLWIFEVELNDFDRSAQEANLKPASRTLRQIFSRGSPKYSLFFTTHRRGKRDAWLEDLNQPEIIAGQWRWLQPVRKAAADLAIT